MEKNFVCVDNTRMLILWNKSWNEIIISTNIKHNTGKLKDIAMAEEISMFLFEGPTSYAPVIEAAIDIVEQSHGQFHVLVIVADGQVNNINFVFVSM